MRSSILLLFLTFTLSLYSQDEDKAEQRFFLGVNVGVKIANKNYAARYAGWYQDQLRNALGIGNINTYNAIYQLLGQKDFILPSDIVAFPTIVRYTPGLITGVTLGYKLSPNLQIGLDADFNKLRVLTGYSIQVIDPSITVTQEQYRTGIIVGQESRFNGRFNFDYIVEGDQFNFIAGISGLFHAWRIDSHIAYFPDNSGIQIPLFSVHDPTNNFTKKTSGLGWGGGLNAGIEHRFTEKIVAQLMYQPYVLRADYYNSKSTIAALGSSYIKPPLRLEHDITVRILWK
ncbi:MAG: hypothetical protein R2780_03165 [Crocinitomicaceae bacterium]